MRLQNPCVREGFGMELLGWEPVCLLRTSQITHWANEATLMKKKKKRQGSWAGSRRAQTTEEGRHALDTRGQTERDQAGQ